MVLAVEEPYPEVDHRKARHIAPLPRFLDAFRDRRAETLGNRAAENLVDEVISVFHTVSFRFKMYPFPLITRYLAAIMHFIRLHFISLLAKS